MGKLVAAKCTQCGAELQVNDSASKLTCKYCGMEFVVQDAITNYVQNNTYNIENAVINMKNEIDDKLDSAKSLIENIKDYEKAYEILIPMETRAISRKEYWKYLILAKTHNYSKIKISKFEFEEIEKYYETLIKITKIDEQDAEEYSNYLKECISLIDEKISKNKINVEKTESEIHQLKSELDLNGAKANELSTFAMLRDEKQKEYEKALENKKKCKSFSIAGIVLSVISLVMLFVFVVCFFSFVKEGFRDGWFTTLMMFFCPTIISGIVAAILMLPLFLANNKVKKTKKEYEYCVECVKNYNAYMANVRSIGGKLAQHVHGLLPGYIGIVEGYTKLKENMESRIQKISDAK